MIAARYPLIQPLKQSAKIVTEPLIEVVNATYVAGGRTILDNARWTIQRGQQWVVLGPNGAGKTTLLRIAAGYLWPNAGGSVRRMGKELLDLRDLRRRIGWVANTLCPSVPRRENVLDTVVSGRFAQVGLTHQHGCEPTKTDYQDAERYLEQLRCQDLREKAFGVLSQGEQQAVLVARAAMAQPLMMILDEPCEGMDPGARERFLQMLDGLLNSKTAPSVVLVTHHVEEILPRIDNLLTVREGKILAQGTVAETLDAELLSTLYDVPVRKIEHSGGRRWPIW